tara:strand:+ start:49 stop:459 length:411 start_codon:yes stop_codon:yes gene_type:complete
MEMSYSIALEILKKELPNEIINNIRKYMVNEIAYEALQQYFNYLYEKKEKYEEFVWNNYVYPNCVCNNCPDNGKYKIYKKRDCNECFKFESTFMYTPNDFVECISDNPQFQKIYYGKEGNDYNEDYYNEDYYSDED